VTVVPAAQVPVALEEVGGRSARVKRGFISTLSSVMSLLPSTTMLNAAAAGVAQLSQVATAKTSSPLAESYWTPAYLRSDEASPVPVREGSLPLTPCSSNALTSDAVGRNVGHVPEATVPVQSPEPASVREPAPAGAPLVRIGPPASTADAGRSAA
jgi:hypothetical protein